MKHIDKIKDWQSPSFLIWLLHERASELRGISQGMSDTEFDALCTRDSFLRKNLQLECRDIDTILQQLNKIVSST